MKQQMSYAYLYMVAAAAGLSVLEWRSDFDGVDTTLSSDADFGDRRGHKLDVQLKCTSSPNFISGNLLSHQLQRERYLKLKEPKRYQIGMIAVLVLPEDWVDWLDQDEERLLSRSCMYFSLTNSWDHIEEGAESKVVHLSRDDVLNPESIVAAVYKSATEARFPW